jgi:hypothetical protein
MLNAASIASASSFSLWYIPPFAVPPATLPVFDVASPVRTVAGRAAALDFEHRAPRRTGMSDDGRSVERPQTSVQSIDFSMLEAVERGERGLPWSGDAAAHAAAGARSSVLERVYEWCGEATRQFLGGRGEAEPPGWRGERGPVPAPRREQRSVSVEDALRQVGRSAPHPRASGTRERGRVPVEDALRQVGRSAPHPRASGTRERGWVPVEDALRQVGRNAPHPRASGTRERGWVPVEDALRQVGRNAPHPRASDATVQRSVSLEDALRHVEGRAPLTRRCNTSDRSDPAAYYAFPEHANPSLCPELRRTLSGRISAPDLARGSRRILDGAQGVLTRMHLALPPNAVTLTVKVSREGGTPEAGPWNRHAGIAGIVARVVSGNASQSIPNLANCRPTEPRTGKQVCTIPVESGRVDGKRFVTVEVFATRAGAPILLEVATS